MMAARLRLGNFWALWTATAFSNLADGVFKLALPLYALRVTDSPVLIAGLAFVMRLPWLLLSLPAGVLADVVDRRQIMIGANIARVVLLALIVVAMVSNTMTLPLLYLAALALGIAETLGDTAAATMTPMVVEPHDLEKANARLVGAMTVTNEFIGPPLGGAIAAVSLGLSFVTSSVLYFVAGLALLMMFGSYRPVRLSAQPPHLGRDVMEGLRFVWANDLLRRLLIIVAVMNLGWSAWSAVMVLYLVAPGPGGLTELGYGVLLTSIGIGGLVGSIITVPLTRWLSRKSLLGMDILGTALMLAVPALTANPWAIGAMGVLGGLGGAMWSIVAASIRQQIIPSDMQGRSGGIFRLFGFGALAVGAAIAGAVAEVAGIPAVFALFAVLNALLIIPFAGMQVPKLARAQG
jgi:MFS family permease